MLTRPVLRARLLLFLQRNAIALVALFVALSGTAYAAASIGSSQIINDSIRSKDIRNSEIVSKDVKDRTLQAVDFKSGELPAGEAGPAGAAGAQGAQGIQGVQGQKGDPSFARTVVVSPGATQTESGTLLRAGLTEAAAIAATLPAGEQEVEVWIEPGVYGFLATITVPAHVSLRGAGADATVLRSMGNTVTFIGQEFLMLAPGSDQVRIADLTVDNDDAPGSFSLVKLADDATLTLDGVRLESDGGTTVFGVYLTTTTGIFNVRDSEISIDAFNASGLRLGSGAARTVRVDNTRIEVDGQGNGWGFEIYGGTTLSVYGGQIVATGDANAGVSVASAAKLYGVDISSEAIGLSGNGGGTIAMVGGVLESVDPQTEFTGGDITCLGVFNGHLDASTQVTKATCN